MKRIVYLFIALTLLQFHANAKEKTKVFEFGDIISLEVGGYYNVYITEGTSNKVTIIYDDQLEKSLEWVLTYSSSGKLSIDKKQLTRRIIVNDPKCLDEINVYLEMDDISSINLGGMVKAYFIGDFTCDSLSVNLTRKAYVERLKIVGNKVTVYAEGNTVAYIEGSFQDSAELNVKDASKVTLKGNTTELEVSNKSNAPLECIGIFERCKFACFGSSNTKLSGEADMAEYECSGYSSISAKELFTRQVSLKLNESCIADIYATDEIQYDISSLSTLTYYGTAELVNIHKEINIINGNSLLNREQ